jgi:aryl-alcohol dehydrogenase-like predicted oxidoreductase
MQYTKLGNTGLTVSRLCLGCMTYGGGPQPPWSLQRDWALGMEDAREHFAVALEAGITFFDTADVYSEGWRRPKLFVYREGRFPECVGKKVSLGHSERARERYTVFRLSGVRGRKKVKGSA